MKQWYALYVFLYSYDVMKWKHFPRYWPFVRRIPHTKASDTEFDVFFDLRLNKRLSKQSCGWWFETPSPQLWRHRNAMTTFYLTSICRLKWCRRRDKNNYQDADTNLFSPTSTMWENVRKTQVKSPTQIKMFWPEQTKWPTDDIFLIFSWKRLTFLIKFHRILFLALKWQ